MSFIRAKQIPPRTGNWYDYEVETIHEGGKVRQRVIRYIGLSGRSGGRSSGNARGLQTRVDTPIISGNPIERTSSIVTCKHCHSENIRKYGTYKGEQRYWCNECKRKFSDVDALPKMKTPIKQIASALGMYYGGMPFDAIQQQFRQDHDLDMSETNYWNWVKRFTKEALTQARSFKPVVGDTWVADETYMKLGKRNVYFWDIIDAKSRFLLASHVSFTRSGRDAQQLMKLAENKAGKTPKVIITDKLKAYIGGIEDTFGADTKHRQGGPFDIESNTNLIERFHGTLEQRTKVFKKYQSIQDIKLLTGGWLINYNYFKQHEALGNVSPAQAMNKATPFKDWNDVVNN